MKLDEYVKKVKAGTLSVPTGAPSGKLLVEGMGALDKNDLEAVTAEAFNLDVFDPEKPWDEAFREVQAAMRG